MSQGNLVNSSDSQNQTKKGKSIKMKIFCNICMVRIGKNDIRGIVTSCQHIVCHICFDLETAKSPKACPKCKRPHISTMKIERNMPAHMMEYFLPPDLKFQQAIDAVNFQNKHMDVDGLLKQLRRKEEYNLGKVELAERKALAEWNELYNAKLEEYRQKFRLSYRYMDMMALQNYFYIMLVLF